MPDAIDHDIPHPTHIGLNIAKAISEDRPEVDGDTLTPHPDPVEVATPVGEVLPDDGTLPSDEYLDLIAAEAGETLARVWDTPQDATTAWIRDGIDRGLPDAPRGGAPTHQSAMDEDPSD